MDRASGAGLAAELGTSVPRVMRAADRLGIARAASGRLALSAHDAALLRDELGVTPRLAGLTPTEVRVLAALRRAPLGLVSTRAVAARASVSPTAASRALRSLEGRDLVYRDQLVIAAGRARRAELWHANLLHPHWADISKRLDCFRSPRSRRSKSHRPSPAHQVPARLRHLFWNVDRNQLNMRRAGPFIARRLLQAQDPEGLAWGAAHLKPRDWQEAATARGNDRRTRALAENLARAGR